MVKLTIVIPAYNAEGFILECLDSVTSQTFEDWACIIVDDGSTDGTLRLLKEYSDHDSRFTIKHISNSGSAKYPIDLGITLSSTPWIVVIGCDDYLEESFLQTLVDRQLSTGADVVTAIMQSVDIFGKTLTWQCPTKSFDFDHCVSGKQALKLTLGDWIIPGNGALIAKKLYSKRKEIHNFMNADEFDFRQNLLNAEKVSFSKAVYYYRQHPNSITKKVSVKLFDSIFVNEHLTDLVIENYGLDSVEAMLILKQSSHDLFAKRALLFKVRRAIGEDQFTKKRKEIYLRFKMLKSRPFSGSGLAEKIIFYDWGMFSGAAWIYQNIKNVIGSRML